VLFKAAVFLSRHVKKVTLSIRRLLLSTLMGTLSTCKPVLSGKSAASVESLKECDQATLAAASDNLGKNGPI
jgi:hypothetical protein